MNNAALIEECRKIILEDEKKIAEWKKITDYLNEKYFKKEKENELSCTKYA